MSFGTSVRSFIWFTVTFFLSLLDFIHVYSRLAGHHLLGNLVRVSHALNETVLAVSITSKGVFSNVRACVWALLLKVAQTCELPNILIRTNITDCDDFSFTTFGEHLTRWVIEMLLWAVFRNSLRACCGLVRFGLCHKLLCSHRGSQPGHIDFALFNFFLSVAVLRNLCWSHLSFLYLLNFFFWRKAHYIIFLFFSMELRPWWRVVLVTAVFKVFR